MLVNSFVVTLYFEYSTIYDTNYWLSFSIDIK